MPGYTERRGRCKVLGHEGPKTTSLYLFDYVAKGFRIPMCQPCARAVMGDEYIDRLIRHKILRWKLPKRESQQETLIPEG